MMSALMAALVISPAVLADAGWFAAGRFGSRAAALESWRSHTLLKPSAVIAAMSVPSALMSTSTTGVVRL